MAIDGEVNSGAGGLTWRTVTAATTITTATMAKNMRGGMRILLIDVETI
jgi:hypothetical protein